MTELERVLRRHGALYPKMRPCDAVKLVYQNEFGGGHLVSDYTGSLHRLREELASAPAVSRRAEPIGNGIVRVFLSGLDAMGYPPEQLNQDFIRSAASHTGAFPSFLAKLECLRALTAMGVFPFSAAQLEEYLTSYAEDGYPPVSHSPEYRAAYQPAYRVVLETLLPAGYQTEIGAFWND